MWVPLHQHSDFSLLDGLCSPGKLASRFEECGYQAAALTDHGSISGMPAFFSECHKKNIKAIAGCEFYVCGQSATIREKSNRELAHLVVLAKNEKGYRNLCRAVSASNYPDHFYYKPRLSLEELASFSEGTFLVFSGHPGSHLGNACFADYRSAYRCETAEKVMEWVAPEVDRVLSGWMGRFAELFGKENFRVEIQRIDIENFSAQDVIAGLLRKAAAHNGYHVVATADSHYATREDAPDQRVILVNALKTTLPEVQRKQENSEDIGLGGFFRSSNYHIPRLAEMESLHTPDELTGAYELAEMCDGYALARQPMMPPFECPDNKSHNEYLRQICRAGWQAKVSGMENISTYRDRAIMEFGVIEDVGLSPYFLMVWDYVRYAREVLGVKVGERGSGAGCLVGYLANITNLDPVQYDLIFERFFNKGRLSPGNIQLPDYDIDFPVTARSQIIEYLRMKYGDKQVAHISTFGRLQGREALKAVLRAHDKCGYAQMNEMTAPIPDESAISDDLQSMREEDGSSSIIRWTLENRPDDMREYCFINKEGNLDGPYSRLFEQAIRLEGVRRQRGVHASGLVITPDNVENLAPLFYDKGHPTVGYDMRDAEYVGMVKADILGCLALDEMSSAEQGVRTGYV